MKFGPAAFSEVSDFVTQALRFETEAWTPRGRTLVALAITLLLVAAAAALHVMFFDALGRGTRYLIFYPAATLAALHGGLCAGLLATALSAAIAALWGEGGSPFTVELIATAVFLCSCILISLIAENLRCSKARARAGQDETLAANAQLQRQLRLYERLGKCIAEIASSAGQAELFNNICRRAVETAELTLSWIGATGEDGWVRPVATEGPAVDDLADIQTPSTKASRPAAVRPAPRSARTARSGHRIF